MRPLFHSLRHNPWTYWGVFVAANAFLAYGGLSVTAELWIALFGLALPFALAVLSRPQAPELSLEREFLPPIPPWLWTFLVALLALSRLADLSAFFGYPLYDESFNAYYALHLTRHWTWYPFFFYSQLPPLYIWMQAGLLRAFGFSPVALWILPALFSTACPVVFYFAARKFLSRSLSFLVFLGAAFSFWPAYLGRLSHQAGLMLLWEGITLWALGSFLNSRAPGGKGRAVVLGLCVGLGFYTYLAWPLVALAVTAAFLMACLKRKRVGAGAVVAFGACALALLLPLLAAAAERGYGGYLATVFHTQPDNNLYAESGGILQAFSFFTVFLWGPLVKDYFTYGPYWGGLLNPLWGGLFLLGLVSLVSLRRRPWVRGMALAFALLWAPVLFTNVFNALRVAALLPLFLAVAALGLQSLLGKRLPGKGSWVLLAGVLFFLSCFLDLTNLLSSRWAANTLYEGQKNQAYVGVYRRLREKFRVEGPGYLFLNFRPDEWDQSLWVMTFPFNVLDGAPQAAAKARWAAVLVPDYYRPYLDRLFPGIQWEPVAPYRRALAGNAYLGYQALLGVFNIDDGERRLLNRWSRADQALEDLALKDHQEKPGDPTPLSLRHWAQAEPAFEGDPFLKAWYWEKRAVDDLVVKRYGDALEDSRKSLEPGLPCGCLYQRYGLLLCAQGKFREGRLALEKAALLDPRFRSHRVVEGPP